MKSRDFAGRSKADRQQVEGKQRDAGAKLRGTAGVGPAETGWWEARLLPVLQRFGLVLAVLAVAAGSGRIVATYPNLSLTYDEPGHLACGLGYLTDHVYVLESQHPPLSRVAMALGPYLDGVRLSPNIPTLYPQLPERDRMGRYAYLTSKDPDRISTLARLGILPFFWMSAWVVYAWGARYFDRGVAALSTVVFTLLPPVLAHSGLATTDMALCAGVAFGFYRLLVWAEHPGVGTGVLFGVAAAVAALAKFTALAFLPGAALFALGAWIFVRRPARHEFWALAVERAPTLALALVCGCLTVWAGYLFSFGEVPGWHVGLPAPEFFDGIMEARKHVASGHTASLFGEKRASGWWYYFPLMLSVKTPLGIMLALVLGVLVAWRRRLDVRYLMPFAFCLGTLAPAMASSVNIGIRHVLPVFCGFSLLAAFGLVSLLQAAAGIRSLAAVTAMALFGWAVVSGARAYPDYVGYFNELAPAERETMVTDSDLEWGQGFKLASRVLRAAGATEVATHVQEWNYLEKLNHLPPQKPLDHYRPTVGWTLISPTLYAQQPAPTVLRGTDLESLKAAYAPPSVWWKRVAPTARTGGLLLYYVPPDSPLLR